MPLLRLDIYGVRNIRKVTIRPEPSFNFFYGENGSGKSAVIEAIFLLGRGRSFRTATIKSVTNTDASCLIIAGLVTQGKANISVGLQMGNKKNAIHINHQPTLKRSDLAYTLPLQLIHPKSYELLDAGAQIRREFLDWGIFNSNDIFLLVWRHFKRSLANRNVLLKKKAFTQLNAWTNEVIAYGVQVTDFREHYLQKLTPVFHEVSRRFFGIDSIDLRLLSGWDDTMSLHQALANDLDKDLRYGFTHSGPHRADFQVKINDRLAKSYVSRGQLKLLVMSLLLAQVQLLINEGRYPPCVLIDDFAAELDIKHRAEVLKYISTLNCQVFITGIEVSDFGSLNEIEHYKMFHVKNGDIKQI